MEATLRPPDGATHLLSDLHDWRRRPLPVADLAPFALPDDAWFEYAWLDADGAPCADPAGVPAGNPWWALAYRLAGPLWAVDPAVAAAPARAAGRLRSLRLRSAALGQERRAFLYSTAAPDEPGPLVVVQDGKSYWLHGRLGPVADLLTARGEVPPAHYLLVHPERRSRDYIFSAPFRTHVLEELLPAAEARVRGDGRRVLLGASLGALAGADLALARPDLFTAVAAHSGAFLIAPGDDPPDPFAGGEWLLRQLHAGRGRDLRWHLECGTLEWLLPCHRRLEAALLAAGCEHRAVERHVGHNWVNWRQALPGTLRSVLAG
ncbi:MAG: esterase family protein [bacterium]|nr:esterase family protein [bacterium]